MRVRGQRLRTARILPRLTVTMLLGASFFLALGSTAFAASPQAPGGSRRIRPQMTVSLDFTAGNPFSPQVTAAAIAEAAAIWRQYGIVIEPGDDGEYERHLRPRARLTLVYATHPIDRPSAQNALAAVSFGADGNPFPRIEVYPDALRAMIDSVDCLGMPPRRWPSPWWDEVTGRVLGRVLAHEIGHYLLRMKGHDAFGLMRPLHHMKDFVDPSSAAFRLNRWDVRRLRSMMEGSTFAVTDVTRCCPGPLDSRR